MVKKYFNTNLNQKIMNEIRENILKKIKNELKPSFIEVIDESHLHANHNPDAKNGGTHFKIKVISSFFEGKSKIEKHRVIHQILDYELKNGLHALTLELTHIE
tara:strand:- start:283 stop:591 length:309 start_codon:yes stop_codon:yes gene_type:complete